MEWTPITELDLITLVQKTEFELVGEYWNFWEIIKIHPEKWEEPNYGNEGGGFWVVALCGKRVIWYNDIEEGFNISSYSNYGHINEYLCNQESINESVMRLFELVKFGGAIVGNAGPPENLDSP